MQRFHRSSVLPGGAVSRRFLTRALFGIAVLVSIMALAACGGTTTPSPAPSAPAAASPAGGAASPAGGAASPAGGAASPAAAGGPATMAATVNMTDDLKYVPDPVTVKKGGTITWKNTGATVHTATDDPSKAATPADASLPAGAKAFDSGDVQPGGSFSHTFDTAGTYKYFCVPHEAAGMLGTITVEP